MARKFVLIVLANYADESHSCYPGQKKIAERIGASVETVRRALADLETSGYISRNRRVRDSGYRTTDRYFLPVDLPTGQFAHKAESGTLPGNLTVLTGQSEGANYTSVKPSDTPQRRATRISDKFAPSPEQLEWAKQHVPLVDVRLETAQFIDHHLAKGSLMKDWGRAWQTWMRNQQKWSKDKQPATAGKSYLDPSNW